MDKPGEEIRTDIDEERIPFPEKGKKRRGLFIGIGAVLIIAAVALFIVAVRPRKEKAPAPTLDDQEQLKYDAALVDQDQKKAEALRNDPFLVRKEDNSQSQLNSIMRSLNIGQDSAANPPVRANDQQAKAEEEAIAHVLRDPAPAQTPPARSNQPRPPAAPNAQPEAANDADAHPMFVYSRTFGGAKYVDAPQKQAAQKAATSTAEQGTDSPATAVKIAPTPAAKPEQPMGTPPKEETTTLLYTELPPVTVYEGEMLEAVLVNRIIADTEASPVVCHLARDFFDRSAKYVIFPVNSRITGQSQVVNYKGSHRLFINFNRIILPNGPSIDLPSSKKALKALDETGALGVVSNVERHWFLQFGTGIFFGALDGLAGIAQRNQSVFSTSAIVLGRTSENFERILENIMAQYSTIVPTIRVDQGKKMRIYLSDDMLISPYAKISDRSYYEKR